MKTRSSRPAVAVPVAGDRGVVADGPAPAPRYVGRKLEKLWTTHNPLSVSQSMSVVEPAVVVPVADDELVVAAGDVSPRQRYVGRKPDIEWITQLPVSCSQMNRSLRNPSPSKSPTTTSS